MEPLRIGVLGAARIAGSPSSNPPAPPGTASSPSPPVIDGAPRPLQPSTAWSVWSTPTPMWSAIPRSKSSTTLANSHKADVATASSLPGVGQGHQVGDSLPGQFGCTFVSDTGDLLQRHIDLQAGDNGRPSPLCHRTIENAVAGKRHRLGVRNRTPAEADQWRTAGRADGHPNRDARSA